MKGKIWAEIESRKKRKNADVQTKIWEWKKREGKWIQNKGKVKRSKEQKDELLQKKGTLIQKWREK